MIHKNGIHCVRVRRRVGCPKPGQNSVEGFSSVHLFLPFSRCGAADFYFGQSAVWSIEYVE
jgi:hypothetical protein